MSDVSPKPVYVFVDTLTNSRERALLDVYLDPVRPNCIDDGFRNGCLCVHQSIRGSNLEREVCVTGCNEREFSFASQLDDSWSFLGSFRVEFDRIVRRGSASE